MELELQGKVAIVGGASKGIGRAIAFGLAREGVRLALYARNAADLDDAARAIRAEAGVNVITVPADAANAADLERVVDSTVRELGGVDILVVNQGGPGYGPALTATDEEWQSGWDLAHMSAVRLARLVVPHMRERGGGRIITITMTGVLQHMPSLAVSSATRLATTGFTKALARELGGDGILVNNVLPGWIETERLRAFAAERARVTGRSDEEVVDAEMTRDVPVGRLGKPEEIADFVTFLASARAAFVTGGNFQVDGGWTQVMTA